MSAPWKLGTDLLVTVCLVTASAAVTYRALGGSASRSTQRAADRNYIPTDPVDISRGLHKGSRTAPVVVIEFTDFQCPYCKQFALETLPELDRAYIATEKVRLVLRHLPIERIHPLARRAAEAVGCATSRGWDVHDALFQAAPRLEDVLATTKPCAAAAKDVDADLAEAMTFGVRSTPSFLIGRIQPDGLVKLTQRISGAARFAEFAQAVDGVLAAQEPR